MDWLIAVSFSYIVFLHFEIPSPHKAGPRVGTEFTLGVMLGSGWVEGGFRRKKDAG